MQCIFCPNGWCAWIILFCPLEGICWNKKIGMWLNIKCDSWQSSHIDILFSVCVWFPAGGLKVKCVLYRYIHENWRLWRGIILYLGKHGNCAALPLVLGARGGAVGWGLVLQAGRLQVWFWTVSLEFFFDIILSATLWSWGQLTLLTEMSTRNISWAVKVVCA